MTRKLPEVLTGLAVIIVAIAFLIYALGQAQAISAGGYGLTAQFSSIGGLTVGSDVKVGGVTVGHVTAERLDPQTYAAVVNMQINQDVKLPTDTSAAISSDGLLGGNYIGLSPGGSDKMLAPGQAFSVTQSAINIEDLLGKFIFSMGGMDKSGGSGAAPAAPGATPGAAPGAAAAPGNPAALSPAGAGAGAGAGPQK
jgi:phospholipid/cholesterol/gamma-HCH transport system substrate-binding protein